MSDSTPETAERPAVWRPMAEAPKDGTRIFGYWPRFGVKTIHWDRGWTDTGSGIVLHKTNYPTLWVPEPTI